VHYCTHSLSTLLSPSSAHPREDCSNLEVDGARLSRAASAHRTCTANLNTARFLRTTEDGQLAHYVRRIYHKLSHQHCWPFVCHCAAQSSMDQSTIAPRRCVDISKRIWLFIWAYLTLSRTVAHVARCHSRAVDPLEHKVLSCPLIMRQHGTSTCCCLYLCLLRGLLE
jgi:hypothetical protein